MSVKPELRQLAVVHMLAERLLQTVDASGLMSPLYRASAAAALAEARGDLEAALTQYGQAVGVGRGPLPLSARQFVGCCRRRDRWVAVPP